MAHECTLEKNDTWQWMMPILGRHQHQHSQGIGLDLPRSLARFQFLVGFEGQSDARHRIDPVHDTQQPIAPHDTNYAIMAISALCHLRAVVDMRGGHLGHHPEPIKPLFGR